jgi:uncharacterized membrane protein
MRTDVVVAIGRRRGLRPIHPLHAILLAFALPLFLAGLLADIAYNSTFQVQWSNFASWLIAGALFVSPFAGLWALVDLLRSRRDTPVRRSAVRSIAYITVLALMWVLGFINALVHAKDAWAVMPTGLWLSLVVTLLALAASWIGFCGLYDAEVE